MKFKSIPKEYRPIPFWNWNEKLDVVETENQIQMMHQVGLSKQQRTCLIEENILRALLTISLKPLKI